jgi:hypothetical protein
LGNWGFEDGAVGDLDGNNDNALRGGSDGSHESEECEEVVAMHGVLRVEQLRVWKQQDPALRAGMK